MKKGIQEKDTTVAFEEISQQEIGVFLVPLVDGGTVDHAVTILIEGVIIHPEEEQVIALLAENRKTFNGARARKLRVREARSVKLLPRKRAKRKRQIEIIIIDDDDDDIAHPPGSKTGNRDTRR